MPVPAWVEAWVQREGERLDYRPQEVRASGVVPAWLGPGPLREGEVERLRQAIQEVFGLEALAESGIPLKDDEVRVRLSQARRYFLGE